RGDIHVLAVALHDEVQFVTAARPIHDLVAEDIDHRIVGAGGELQDALAEVSEVFRVAERGMHFECVSPARRVFGADNSESFALNVLTKPARRFAKGGRIPQPQTATISLAVECGDTIARLQAAVFGRTARLQPAHNGSDIQAIRIPWGGSKANGCLII